MFSDSQIIEQYNRVISDQFININHNIFTQNNSKQLLQSYNSILDHQKYDKDKSILQNLTQIKSEDTNIDTQKKQMSLLSKIKP